MPFLPAVPVAGQQVAEPQRWKPQPRGQAVLPQSGARRVLVCGLTPVSRDGETEDTYATHPLLNKLQCWLSHSCMQGLTLRLIVFTKGDFKQFVYVVVHIRFCMVEGAYVDIGSPHPRQMRIYL